MPDSNVAELTRIDWWIYQQLVSDPQVFTEVGGRIYADQAPQGSDGKMIIFSHLGGSDKGLTSRARLSNSIYLIRAIAKNSTYRVLETAADRIEAVMTVPDGGVIVRDVRITGVAREQPFKRTDNENGIPVVHLGGLYRVRYQSAAL